VKKCNQHILEALELSRKLFILSDEGESDAEDNSCVVLYGVIRDAAYKIRNHAERERQQHIQQRKWEKEQNLNTPL
jgi:hypothetical protein